MTPNELTRDLVTERAAIIQEGEKCSALAAQNYAAKRHGFKSWHDFMRATK